MTPIPKRQRAKHCYAKLQSSLRRKQNTTHHKLKAMTATASKPKRRNSAFQRLMDVHWWMAGCYLLLFLTGPLMSRLPRDVFGRTQLYDFHKSIAIISLILLVWRIATLVQVFWKKYTRRCPKTTSKWWQKTLLHVVLYILMVGVPLSGFLLSNSFKVNGVSLFGIPVPDIFPENKDMVEVGRALHFWSSYVFLLFVACHTYQQWHVVRGYWKKMKKKFST